MNSLNRTQKAGVFGEELLYCLPLALIGLWLPRVQYVFMYWRVPGMVVLSPHLLMWCPHYTVNRSEWPFTIAVLTACPWPCRFLSTNGQRYRMCFKCLRVLFGKSANGNFQLCFRPQAVMAHSSRQLPRDWNRTSLALDRKLAQKVVFVFLVPRLEWLEVG